MVSTGAHVRWNGNYFFGNEGLVANSELGSLVAAVIAGWAITEAHLGRTFSALVGSKQPVTMSMYAAIRSPEAQRDLLKTAAYDMLPKRYAMLFDAAVTVLYKASGHRHKFAHWVWGVSADPDLKALLLVDPKHFWSLSIAQIKHWSSKKSQETVNRLGPLGFFANQPKLNLDNILVYCLKDLQEARERVERSFRIADALRQFARSDTPRRREIYRWLCNEPDLRSALEKVKANHPSSPPTRLELPRKAPSKKAPLKKE